MKTSNNLKKLVSICADNIKSFSKKNEIIDLFPIEIENFKISFVDNKLVFKFNNKVSYLYPEKYYFSNLEIMKRIGYMIGIELKSEDIFSITKFVLEIKEQLI